MTERVESTVSCCETGRRFIHLSYRARTLVGDRGTRSGSGLPEDVSREGFLDAARSTPPSWSMVAVDHVGYLWVKDYQMTARISSCPFCGTPVPALALRSMPPEKIQVIFGYGDCCDTCEERLDSCDCAPIESLWEPSREERRL